MVVGSVRCDAVAGDGQPRSRPNLENRRSRQSPFPQYDYWTCTRDVAGSLMERVEYTEMARWYRAIPTTLPKVDSVRVFGGKGKIQEKTSPLSENVPS